MENLFYELIQIALGKRERLSRVPSEQEWTMLFECAKKQAVVGVAFDALEQLSRQDQKPPRKLLLQWMGTAQRIKVRNADLDNHCQDLLELLSKQGIRGSILKGQGVARYYDEPLKSLRQSGDIDVYVDGGIKSAVAFAKELGLNILEWDYKHLRLKFWKNVDVEMHYRVEVLLNLNKNRRLQQWFKEHEELIYEDVEGLKTPAISFNVFYILLHTYRHFLYEGVGLRQIIDYYFTLGTYSKGKSSTVALDAVRSFGMERFAQGLMWVMQEVLAMPSDWMLWEPDEKEGKYILEQVMTGGNFGHHDKRLQGNKGKIGAVIKILKHNMHLLSHYPSDTVWAPVWIVWHKIWKIKNNNKLI